jgi:uncharacterized DUF497 family protein
VGYASSVGFDSMLFEWDDDKYAETVAARGIDRVAGWAPGVWRGSRARGGDGGGGLHVVITDRDEVRRIISVRKANRRERKAWQRRG